MNPNELATLMQSAMNYAVMAKFRAVGSERDIVSRDIAKLSKAVSTLKNFEIRKKDVLQGNIWGVGA